VLGVQQDPGGKGINVSRVLRQFGCPTAALGFLGGSAGQSITDAMATLAIDSDFIAVPGETRTNLTVTDGEREIKVNEPAPSVPQHAVDALIARVRQRARESSAVVLSGSLPPGIPVEFYAELIRIIRGEGSKPVLDTAGPPLAHGAAAGPYLIKPNGREAKGLLGIFLDTDDVLREAVRCLSGYGIPIVALSFGAGGAVCACGGTAWRAEIPPVAALTQHGRVGGRAPRLPAACAAGRRGTEHRAYDRGRRRLGVRDPAGEPPVHPRGDGAYAAPRACAPALTSVVESAPCGGRRFPAGGASVRAGRAATDRRRWKDIRR
jgi:1-phosphofructokinase family hexose kinase